MNCIVLIPKIISGIIIASLLHLLSCKDQTSKNDTSLDAFENRPIHKIVTEKIIDTTLDDELIQIVVDNFSAKLPNDYKKEYETVSKWTKSQQAIYIIWLLEAEVNNGGFNQYYFNSSGQFAELAPEALKLVGATRYADLTTKANAVYKQEHDKITKYQDGTLEGFSKSYEDNPLSKFDDEFYELEKIENLQKLQVDFIRKHKIEFVDN